MALHTLGSNSTTSLQCTAPWGGTTTLPLTATDIAAINLSICDDGAIGPAVLAGQSFGVTAVLASGSVTASTTTVTAVTTTGVTGAVAPIGQIQAGDAVLGIGITAGTFVAAVASGGATVTLSQNATATSSEKLAFVRLGSVIYGQDVGGIAPNQQNMSGGLLNVPSRGSLQILPGDVVAIDNTGWPILLSATARLYNASQWTFT